MTADTFNIAVEIAHAMCRLERPEYWVAFARGLQRAGIGDPIVSREEHADRLSMRFSTDLRNVERYDGYRDGLLAFGGMPSQSIDDCSLLKLSPGILLLPGRRAGDAAGRNR